MEITEIQEQINLYDGNRWELHDGYHTFNELYEHRIILYISLCKQIVASRYKQVRASKKHFDWTSRDWRFIMWIGTIPWTIITYHLPDKYWNDISKFAMILENWLERDWHTSNDVLDRLLEL